MSVINGFVWLGAVNEEINPVWHSLPLRVLASIVAIILLIYLYKSRINWQYEKKISRLKYKIKDIEKEKDGLNAEIQQLREKIKKKDAGIASLEEEIEKKESIIRQLNDKLKSCQKTLSEIESKNRALPEENPEYEEDKIGSVGKEHYGDNEYWDGEQLYSLKISYPDLTYRKMSEITGIPKSTIQLRIKEYIKNHTTIN